MNLTVATTDLNTSLKVGHITADTDVAAGKSVIFGLYLGGATTK